MKYEKPELNVIEIGEQDIITKSHGCKNHGHDIVDPKCHNSVHETDEAHNNLQPGFGDE